MEGFDHISLESFINNEIKGSMADNSINTIFKSVIRDEKKYIKDKTKLKRFIKDNINLGNEVQRLSKVAIEISKETISLRRGFKTI